MGRCVSPLRVKTAKAVNYVPCGKCNFCLEARRGDWSFRLNQELKHSMAAEFLTLTYDEDHLVTCDKETGEYWRSGTLVKSDVQLFTKRLRKVQSNYTDIPLRYYTVGEYGTRTERAHYHSIMFNMHRETLDRVQDCWGLGNVHVGSVTQASIHYTTKYVINAPGHYGGRQPPFSFMSKRPGIGSTYVETHGKWHVDGMRTYTEVNGVVARLPRYYRDRMFNKAEASRLAGELVPELDRELVSELERLSFLHPDAFAYYEERRIHAHESVKSKVNKTNKL